MCRPLNVLQLVETIWEGDVKGGRDAYALICIVDQIHDYAITQHRRFVMEHLEAGHNRQAKSLEQLLINRLASEPMLGVLNNASPDSDSDDMTSWDSYSSDDTGSSSSSDSDLAALDTELAKL